MGAVPPALFIESAAAACRIVCHQTKIATRIMCTYIIVVISLYKNFGSANYQKILGVMEVMCIDSWRWWSCSRV
jgi:hypothetical protein